MKCPQCNSENVIHSRRRGFEHLIKYIAPFSPYRCKECWNRFWSFKNPFSSTAAKVIAAIILIAIASPLVYYQLGTIDWGNGKKNTNKRIDSPPPVTNDPVVKPADNDSKTKLPDISTYFPDEKLKAPGSSSAQPNEPENQTMAQPIAALPSDSSQSPQGSSIETPPVQRSEPAVQKPLDNPAAVIQDPPAPIQEPQPAKVLEPSVSKIPADGNQGSPKPVPELKQVEKITPVQKLGRAAVTAIRTNDADKGTHILILTNQPIDKYQFFDLFDEGILKFVIDLKGKWDCKVKTPIMVDNDLILRIRTGYYEDKLRVVADLKVKKIEKPVITSREDGIGILLKQLD